MPPAFVEVMVPRAVGASECTIELEGGNGKLRIYWKGATAADVADFEPGVAGRGLVIQIALQIRILVAPYWGT